MIPNFREDGYLPEGLHFATEAETIFRFGGRHGIVVDWHCDFDTGLNLREQYMPDVSLLMVVS